MVARRLTKRLSNAEADIDHLEQQPPEQQQQTDEGRFRVKVDRQTKSSYETYEAAEAAGMTIKKGHPIVQVAVYDTVAGEHKVLELLK